MANWADNNWLIALYTSLIDLIQARFTDVCTMFNDLGVVSNPPNHAMRYNRTTHSMEEYSTGSSTWIPVPVAARTYSSPTFNASDYSGNSGSWIVAAVNISRFFIENKRLGFMIRVETSSIIGAPTHLLIRIPTGVQFANASEIDVLVFLSDNSTSVVGQCGVYDATHIYIHKQSGAPFTGPVAVYLKSDFETL